jgi:hypothetical protein
MAIGNSIKNSISDILPNKNVESIERTKFQQSQVGTKFSFISILSDFGHGTTPTLSLNTVNPRLVPHWQRIFFSHADCCFLDRSFINLKVDFYS